MSDNFEAVRNIPGDQAKAILLTLCTNPAIYAKVASYAKRLDEEASSKKRKPESTIAICVVCDQPFYEEENDETSCVHHDGRLEVNHKAQIWEDLEDDGPYGSSDEEDYPEGFNWNCCGKVGTSDGCMKSPHQSDPEKASKIEYAKPQDYENDEDDE